VALVITLILLAVITTLAIAFLALTYREGAAVDSLARTTDSELACESAQQRARAEILAPFARNDTNRFSWATNGLETMGPDFMVSVAWDTNWWNPRGMITNPSPPVFVSTNRSSGPAGPFENRSYLDLNRNRHFEDTGYVQDTDDNFRPIPNQFNWRVGDPQWIGILQDPRRPHTNDNRFIARYAYLIQPIGRSLDVNWVHNQAIEGRAAGVDGYFRNQGVGGWEVNLAALLTDANTNEWNNPLNLPYSYTDNPMPAAFSGVGLAFNDARAFLNFRSGGNRNNLNTVNDLFPGLGNAFLTDQIDDYANGFTGPAANPDLDDNPSRPWPGSDSRRHYFSVHDLWSKLPEPLGFTNQLARASTRGNSYDRYTYYRMMAQMGTDSAEEEDGKVNINYMNIRSWANPNYRLLASDLIPWSTNSAIVQVPRLGGPVDMGRVGPELFFLTVVTNLLLREPALAFIVTNPPPPGILQTPLRIPIFTNRAFAGLRSTVTTNLPLPGPLYAGRIHQILQLAANIHEATTGSKRGEPYPYFPNIFRPRFQTAANGDVYIIDYTLVPEGYVAFRSTTDALWKDLDSGDTVTSTNDLVYGIPLIIGARKGFPNFNEIAALTSAEATRKLRVFRANAGTEPDKIEQDFTLKIRSKIQIEARNSWVAPYPRSLRLEVGLRVGMQVTNSTTQFPYRNWVAGTNYIYLANRWPGEPLGFGQEQTNSFVLTPVFETNVMDWKVTTPIGPGNVTNFWSATLTNRMLFFIVDTAYDRIVDFVTLNRPQNHFEIGKLMEDDLPDVGEPTLAKIWSSAKANNMSLGVANQLSISQNGNVVGDTIWGDYDLSSAPSKQAAAQKFLTFMRDKLPGTNQAPYTPTRTMVQANYYQVGDPLVHYTFEDLRDDPDPSLKLYKTETPDLNRLVHTNLSTKSLGRRSDNALTWNRGDLGVSDSTSSAPGEGLLDPRLRDPGILYPELWDFPTNSFPNIGWLGRVHRGTPWQSIYLKSRGPSTAADWKEHSGNQRHPNSASLMIPTRDWELLDIFTTAPHPNATRGRLSINQTNVAAWSAVLSGAVTSETQDDPNDPGLVAPLSVTMLPAAISPAIERIVEGINQQRVLTSSNRYNGYLFAPFNKLSDLLSAPELTEGSPFLNVNQNLFDGYKPTGAAKIMDADYERIPQQILSLVKLGEPRFVVYAWGQSLKPARRNPEDTGPSIVTSGADQGLCRNYQITGEMATRAVIRIEFDRITNPFSPQYNQLDYSRPHAVVESFNILPVE
jgi:hypothetical protein